MANICAGCNANLRAEVLRRAGQKLCRAPSALLQLELGLVLRILHILCNTIYRRLYSDLLYRGKHCAIYRTRCNIVCNAITICNPQRGLALLTEPRYP